MKTLPNAILLIALLAFSSIGQTAEPRNDQPRRIKILSNLGSIPFVDGITVIGEIAFEGLDPDLPPELNRPAYWMLTPTSIRSRLTDADRALAVGGRFSGGSVARAVRSMREWAVEMGYPDAHAEAFGEITGKNEMRLTFVLERGELGRIAAFEFDGNEKVTSEELTKECSASLDRFDGIFRPREARYFLQKCVLDSFWSRGFLEAEVKEVKFRSNAGRGIAEVSLFEGMRFRLRTTEFGGVSILTRNQLIEMLGMPEGEYVNALALRSFVLEKLKRIYHENGYLNYEAEYNFRFSPFIDRDSDRFADVQFDVSEEFQYRVSTVEFIGVDEIAAAALARDFPLKRGDICNLPLVHSHFEDLNKSGKYLFIDRAQDMELKINDENRTVDIVVRVQREMPSQGIFSSMRTNTIQSTSRATGLSALFTSLTLSKAS